MSHGGPGYYYLSYNYRVPYSYDKETTYTDSNGKTQKKIVRVTATDSTYYSAVYSSTQKQSHQGQTDWRNNVAMPAIKKDMEKNFDAYRNKQGRKYEPYSEQYVKTIEFKYCPNVPTHTEGPRKGLPYGNKV
jgi:hypothetical protein